MGKASSLFEFETAIKDDVDPFENVIRTPSPSFNFLFGRGHGLPRGYTAIVYGPPKGGKTLVGNHLAAQFHKDSPTGCVVKFDTEFRERIQNPPARRAAVGIDNSRYRVFETNRPAEIFDFIERDLAARCEKGLDLGMIIIDSVSSIQGRREQESDSVEKQTIGDHAMTTQIGFKRILPIIRRYNIALFLTTQVRAEMDPLQQMRGVKVKMQSANAVKHFGEFFIYLERNENKAGRVDLLGKGFNDEARQDIRQDGDGEQVAHKIRVTMKENSAGPRGRQAEFTIHQSGHIINVHEEVYLLGVGRGIIQKPNNTAHVFGDKKWNGKPAMLEALERDTDLQNAILKELRRRDLAGEWEHAETNDAPDAPDIE